MDKMLSYFVWDLFDSIICERQFDWKDVCFVINWWKSRRSEKVLILFSIQFFWILKLDLLYLF